MCNYPGSGRELGHASLPRMREAQLIRTYRPNPRYLPHHMRRQRQTGPGAGESEAGELMMEVRMMMITRPSIMSSLRIVKRIMLM